MLLSPQKEQFITEYLVDGDAIKAAIRCGCDADNVQVIAEEWLADPRVVTRIADVQYAQCAMTGVHPQWIRQQLLTIVIRCMEPRPVGTTNEQGEGVWGFDSLGATAALELLGKHIGFFGRHNQQLLPTPITSDYVAPDAADLSASDHA